MTINPDPDPIRIQGFHDQKLKKKLQLKILYIFFLSKIAIYLSLGLQKACPSYRRSHPTLQNMNFYKFFSTFVGHFSPPNPDPEPDSESGSGSTDPIESGSNPDPQPW
jgi:hypothetical protein